METVPANDAGPVAYYINLACLYIFTADVLMRMLALNPGPYLKDHWAKLDVFVVLCAWVSTGVLARDLPPGFGLIRSLRIFRVIMVMIHGEIDRGFRGFT